MQHCPLASGIADTGKITVCCLGSSAKILRCMVISCCISEFDFKTPSARWIPDCFSILISPALSGLLGSQSLLICGIHVDWKKMEPLRVWGCCSFTYSSVISMVFCLCFLHHLEVTHTPVQPLYWELLQWLPSSAISYLAAATHKAVEKTLTLNHPLPSPAPLLVLWGPCD